MINTLREEEKDDIAHRDRCEDKHNANKNSKEDAEHAKSKAAAEIKRLEQAILDKQADVKQIEEDMAKTKTTMEEMTTQRNKETDEFKKAMKADQDSIELLQKAQDELGKFYRSLLQVGKKPNTNWEGGDYKGSTGEAQGVVAILDMLQEDLRKEIKSAGQDEVDAQSAYEE